NWYRSSSTVNKVLRPHLEHAYPNGDVRYLSTSITAQSGDLTRTLSPFPFNIDLDGDGDADERLGVWDGSGEVYTFDADLNDGGIPDSILLDLEHPIIELPGGRQV